MFFYSWFYNITLVIRSDQGQGGHLSHVRFISCFYGDRGKSESFSCSCCFSGDFILKESICHYGVSWGSLHWAWQLVLPLAAGRVERAALGASSSSNNVRTEVQVSWGPNVTLKKGSNLGFLKIYFSPKDWLEIYRDLSYQQVKAQRPRVKLRTASQTKGIHLTKEFKWEVFNRKITKDSINTLCGKTRGIIGRILLPEHPKRQIPTDPGTLGQLNSCPFHHCPGVSHVVISKQLTTSQAKPSHFPAVGFQNSRRSVLREEKRLTLNDFGHWNNTRLDWS